MAGEQQKKRCLSTVTLLIWHSYICCCISLKPYNSMHWRIIKTLLLITVSHLTSYNGYIWNLRENHNFQGHKVFLGKIRTLNSGWYTFFATHCISHLNTEVDWIFLAVDVTLWVVYICALVSNPWLATDRFLKTGHSGPHFADKPVVDSRNATAALFFFGNKTYVHNFA